MPRQARAGPVRPGRVTLPRLLPLRRASGGRWRHHGPVAQQPRTGGDVVRLEDVARRSRGAVPWDEMVLVRLISTAIADVDAGLDTSEAVAELRELVGTRTDLLEQVVRYWESRQPRWRVEHPRSRAVSELLEVAASG